jgi:hypothetical protein
MHAHKTNEDTVRSASFCDTGSIASTSLNYTTLPHSTPAAITMTKKESKNHPAKEVALKGAKKQKIKEPSSSDFELLEKATTPEAKRPLGRPKRSQEEQDEEAKEEQKEEIDIDIPTEVEFSKDATGELEMLAMNGDWDAVLDIVRQDPKQAGIVQYGEKSETALHWAAYGNAPLPVLKALVEAAPHTVAFSAGLHSQGPPLGILLNQRLFQPDIMEKVLVLLRGDHQGGKTSLFGLYAYGLSKVIRKALRKYPAGTDMPETGPFSFVEDTRSERDKTYTTLTTKESKDTMWDIFSTIVKAAHYKTTENIDKLPLLPAIMLFEGDLPTDDGDGCINYEDFPKDAIDLAVRLAVNQEGAMKDSSDGQYFLHKLIANRSRAMDNDRIMTLFGQHPALLKHRNAKSGLYPFLLAATPTVGDKDGREERAEQILAKRMVEWRSEAMESYCIGWDDEESMDDEDFNAYLEDWVMDNSEDLHDDLYCNSEEFSCETAYCEAEREKWNIKNCFDLSYRILRECPEVLQNATTVSDRAATTNSAIETTTHKKEDVEDGGGSKKHRM